jgi:PrtD family type I secretion system ABC transporter
MKMNLKNFSNASVNSIWLSFLPLRGQMLAVFGYSFVINLLLLLPSLYMLEIFDRILVNRNLDTLKVVSFIFIIVFIFQYLFDLYRSRIMLKMSDQLEKIFSKKVFEQVINEEDKSFSYQAFLDLTKFRQFIAGSGFLALMDLPWVIIYILVAYLMHPMIGMTAIFFAITQLIIAVASHRLIKNCQLNYLSAEKKQKGYFRAHVRGFDTVLSHGMLNAFNEKWLKVRMSEQEHKAYLDDSRRVHQSIAKFARYTMQSLSLAVGAYLVIEGKLSLGAMVASNLLVARVLSPIDNLVTLWPQLHQINESLINLSRIFKQSSLTCEHNLHANHLETIQNISVKNLSVIKGNKKAILHDISFDIKNNDIVAIVGPSGSGKSTLLRSLVGLEKGFKGEIRYNGQSISDVVPSNFGYLSQTLDILEGTVAENISRFNLSEPEKIFQAANLIELHKAILAWPNGYGTHLGQNRFNLSSGMAQRLGIARAIYGDVTVVLLDEPNSHLDDLAERALENCLVRLKESGVIVILVSHRKSILKIATKIIRLDSGKIISSESN